MSADEFNAAKARRQELLGQLKIAEVALRRGLHTRGFGETAPAHMERARSHILEAYIAINEGKPVRSVQQLVDDLNRIQQVMDGARKFQRI